MKLFKKTFFTFLIVALVSAFSGFDSYACDCEHEENGVQQTTSKDQITKQGSGEQEQCVDCDACCVSHHVSKYNSSGQEFYSNENNSVKLSITNLIYNSNYLEVPKSPPKA